MEAITRLVADSLARHGLDRPIDPRRLQWSRWFRCDSPHSLLVVPSKPGIFALAEDVGNAHVAADAYVRAEEKSELGTKRMLAVLKFSEDDDMAFTLDRMFTCVNPMRARLASGRCFLRFVVIEDQAQRRSICTALNQWMLSSAERATGLPADFQLSLELTESVARMTSSASAESSTKLPWPANAKKYPLATPPHLDSGAAKNLHCPHPLPSGF